MTLSPRIGLTSAPAGVVRGTRDEEALDGLQSSVVPHGRAVDAAYESQPRPALLEPVAAAAVHLDENTGRSASRSARRARLTSRWLVVGGWTSRADWVVEVVRRPTAAVAVHRETAPASERQAASKRRTGRTEGSKYAAACRALSSRTRTWGSRIGGALPEHSARSAPSPCGGGDLSPAAHGMTKSLAVYTPGPFVDTPSGR